MTDPKDRSVDPRPDSDSGADGAPEPSLPPELETALRDASTWKEPAPNPSLLSRAMAEHNAELADVRAARGWPRQWGLMAASAVLAGVGISIGVINTDRPSFRYVFAGGDSLNYAKSAGGRLTLTTVDAAKSDGEQDTITEIQQRARQLTGDQAPLLQARDQNLATTTGAGDSPTPAVGKPSEPDPALVVVPPAAAPAAPAVTMPTAPALSRSKDTSGAGSDAGSKTENTALDGRGNTNTSITNTNVADMSRSAAGENAFGQPQRSFEEQVSRTSAASRPSDETRARRSDTTQPPSVTKQLPTTKDWLRYGVRVALGGGPWIFLAGSMLAIIWIRRRP